MNDIGPAQLEILINRHSGPLLLYARQWCAVPEDVVQDVFFRLVRQKAMPDNPVGWLYRAVRNRAIDMARRENRRRRHEKTVATHGEPWFKPVDGAGLDVETATKALKALPIEQRETIVARLWGGLSFSEIAKLTYTSSSTAARRYQSGLSAMRERLRVPCEQTKNSQRN